jgi:hypothetical protein
MTVNYCTTRWVLTQGVRLAWAMAQVARRLGDAGVRLEVRLDAVAVARGIDMLDVLRPLTERLPIAGGHKKP